MKRFHLACVALGLLGLAGGCRSLASFSDDCADTEVIDPAHFWHKPVRSWKAMNQDFVVMQQHDFSCGAACLATLAQHYWGADTTEEQFLRAIFKRLTDDELRDRVENGLSMTDMRRAAVDLGYEASILKVSFAQLMSGNAPVIVRIDRRGHEHFVVVRGFAEDRVFLADPIRGNVRESVDLFAQEWNDGAILVIARPNVDPPTVHDLMVTEPSPVSPEYEAGRKNLRTWPYYPIGKQR